MNMKKKTKMSMDNKLNMLRAGVLGANDGILTVVGVLFSVVAATTNPFIIFIAGLSDLLSCAFSMSAGEYASVSSQRDTEKAAVGEEKLRLKADPEAEYELVANFYMEKGVTEETAHQIARSLMDTAPLKTAVDVHYDMDLDEYLTPWGAAISSLFSAALGGVFPLVAMTLAPSDFKMQATIIATVFSVALTGFLSSKLGNGLPKKAVIRNVIVGIITMFIHYYIGKLF
ncbi:VIT1/CCC1 transporter family protein [Pediococcus acidilactici]|uniref:VIT1/CCC1 transporter family protein n=1 Tax=Pediococcus acidilactici TaxID=1254 RepID=UPI0037094D63